MTRFLQAPDGSPGGHARTAYLLVAAVLDLTLPLGVIGDEFHKGHINLFRHFRWVRRVLRRVNGSRQQWLRRVGGGGAAVPRARGQPAADLCGHNKKKERRSGVTRLKPSFCNDSSRRKI
jgi:hypothetical protein